MTRHTTRRATSGHLVSAVESLESRLQLSTSVISYHNDLQADGVNASETILTPANVKVGSFGKLFTTALDGNAYAQPLVVSGEKITAGVNTHATAAGIYDVVYVETQNDSIYAINSDTGDILWQRNFLSTNGTTIVAGTNINNPLLASAITAPTSFQVSCTDISPTYGITGTPVIDVATNRMYVVVFTREMLGKVATYVQRIHAINLSDGTDAAAPYQIGATSGTNTNATSIYVYGSGDGSVTDPYNNTGKTVVQFNALRENQRMGLSLVDGNLFVSYASHCDQYPYHGWIVSWDVSNLATEGLQLSGVFCTSPNGGGAGLWSSGGALSFDPNDDSTLYFETGNGYGSTTATTVDANGMPADGAYYEAVVKVSRDTTSSPTHQNVNGWGMKAVDYFIPYNQLAMDNVDQDLGSGGPVALPDSAGIQGHPHLLVAGGKQGVVYLIDRDNMGKFDGKNDHVVNAVLNSTGTLTAPVNVRGVLCTPVYFNGTLYYVGGYGGRSVSLSITAKGTLAVKSQSAAASFGYLPGSPVLSSNGLLNGIIWQMDRSTNELHAFDAATYATELWNSDQKAGDADAIGSAVKFATPTVANGRVFVGSSNSLVGFGLTPPSSTAPAAPVLNGAAVSGSSVNLTWTDSSVAPNLATGYLVDQSTDGKKFTQATTAGAAVTSLQLGGLSANTKYYFRIRGQNSVGLSAYSTTIAVTTLANVPAILDGSFEGTSVSGKYLYAPKSAAWTFTGNAGIEANGSVWKAANAPSGTQAAFLQSVKSTAGNISQKIAVNAAQSVQLSFAIAQRAGYGVQPIAVSIDGKVIATVTPDSTAFATFTTPIFNLSAGAHVLAFSTAKLTITDTASFIDAIAFVPASGAVAPNSPSALGAVPSSATTVSLSWVSNSNNQTGYKLDRATDAAFTHNLVTQSLASTPTSFVDSSIGLASGGTYYYRLRAINSAGSSANSNVAVAVIPFAPATASNLVFDSVKANTITMHWTDNAGTSATGYHILRATGSSAFVLYTTLPGTNSKLPMQYDWTDTGMVAGTKYSYHIQAFNIAGYNDFVGGNANTLCSAPVGVSAALSAGKVTLSWTRPIGAVSFNIYRGTAAGRENATPLVSGVTSSTYVDTKVIAGATYYYYLSAVNGNLSPLNAQSAPSLEVSSANTASKLTGKPIGSAVSYSHVGDTVAQVFDGNLSTFYDAPDDHLTYWAGLDLGSAKTLSQVKFAPRVGQAFRMVNAQIQVSNTADFSSNVTTIYTITTAPEERTLTTAAVNPIGKFRYIRYIGGTQWVNVAELQVYGN